MKARKWIAFLCGAVILQGIFLLFCTEAGLMTMYPLLMRVSEEEYQTKGAYTVYYDMRLAVSDAPSVAVGVDFDVAQSYDAFQHLFRFIKQYRNVQFIVLEEYGEYAEGIRQRMNDPITDPGLPPVLLQFADTLAAINNTQPPNRKCTVLDGESGTAVDVPAGSVLYLMDRDAMMADQDSLAGTVVVEMKYVNCDTGEGIRRDIDLPFAGEEVRYSFLPASRIDWFYKYFDRVTNLLKTSSAEEEPSVLDAVSAEYVICISNGTAADWGE